jgi:phage-related protein (TIGR01555 family)
MSESRRDGWFNLLSGLGVKDKDKRANQSIEWSRTTEDAADLLYAGDDILARIIEQLPIDALREGFDLKDESLQKQFDSLLVSKRILEAWVKARQYGGSAILYITNAQDMAQPMGQGERVTGLVVLSRWELVAAGTKITTDLKDPNFGFPELYQFQTAIGQVDQNLTMIHHSRLERFHGVPLPRRLFVSNNYWHDSVIGRVYNAVRNYQLAHDSAAAIVADFNVGVWKMKGLADLVAAGKEAQIRQRIEIANYAKSVVKSIILDDSESYEDKARNVTGLPEVLKMIGGRLVAATNIPHTILLGESPTGSNSTGNSTTMSWYDYVKAQQEGYLRPHLGAIARKLDQNYDPTVIEFRPLWQMDEKDEAQIRKTQAETDGIYISNGVLDPEEVAVSRFGGDKYSTQTELSRTPTVPGTPAEVQATAPVKTDAKPSTRVQTLILSKKAFPSIESAHSWVKEHNFELSKPEDETEESYRFRQIDPGQFVEGSMKTIELKHGVKAVIGVVKDQLVDPDPDEDDGDDARATGGDDEGEDE